MGICRPIKLLDEIDTILKQIALELNRDGGPPRRFGMPFRHLDVLRDAVMNMYYMMYTVTMIVTVTMASM